MKTNSNDPVVSDLENGEGFKVDHGPLTKRELLAGMAMQGLLAAIYSSKDMLNEFTKVENSPESYLGRSYLSGCEAVSSNAVAYADALIKELNKETK